MWNSLHLELDFIKMWRINIDTYSRFMIKLNKLNKELVLSLDILIPKIPSVFLTNFCNF
jgi:hypothetical protein